MNYISFDLPHAYGLFNISQLTVAIICELDWPDLPCPTLTWPHMIWPDLACPDLPCPALPCPVLPCPAMPWPDLTWPGLIWPVLTGLTYLNDGDSGKRPGVAGYEGDDCEHCGDSQTGSGGGGVSFDEERHPAEGHTQHWRDDGLDEVVAHVPLEDKRHYQTGVRT